MDISDVEARKALLERELTEHVRKFVEETGANITKLSLHTATQTDGTEHPVHVHTTVEVAPTP